MKQSLRLGSGGSGGGRRPPVPGAAGGAEEDGAPVYSQVVRLLSEPCAAHANGFETARVQLPFCTPRATCTAT